MKGLFDKRGKKVTVGALGGMWATHVTQSNSYLNIVFHMS